MNALTLKNLLREIKRTFTKFLSIFAICALGVAFFAGIRATSPDMKEAGDRLYNTYNLSDISVISTSGLTADNIRDLESIEGPCVHRFLWTQWQGVRAKRKRTFAFIQCR